MPYPYTSARHFVELCKEAGIARGTRNYLWSGFREEGFVLVNDDFWAPMVENLSNRVQAAEADADRLYSFVLTGGDKQAVVAAHFEAKEVRIRT